MKIKFENPIERAKDDIIIITPTIYVFEESIAIYLNDSLFLKLYSDGHVRAWQRADGGKKIATLDINRLRDGRGAYIEDCKS